MTGGGGKSDPPREAERTEARFSRIDVDASASSQAMHIMCIMCGRMLENAKA